MSTSLLITSSDSHFAQLWVVGEEKPRRIFSVDSVARGCLSLCRFHQGYHFTCIKHSVAPTSVEATPGSFQFFSLAKEQSDYKCSAPEGLVILKYSFTGRYLLGGDIFGRMYLWEVSSGALLVIWDAHWRSISDISFAEDGVVFVTGSEDGTLKSWSLLQVTQMPFSSTRYDKISPLSTFRGHTMPVTSVCCGRYALRDWIFSCSLDCTVRVWKLSSGEWLHTYSLLYPLVCLTMHHHEAVVFTSTNEGKVYQIFIYLQSGSCPIQQLWEQVSPVCCLCWIPQQHLLVIASEDGNIKVYDYKKRERIQTYNKMLGKVSNIQLVGDIGLEKKDNDISTQRWNVHLKRVPISFESTGECGSVLALYEPTKYDEKHSRDQLILDSSENEEERNVESVVRLAYDDDSDWIVRSDDRRVQALFQYYYNCIYERIMMMRE